MSQRKNAAKVIDEDTVECEAEILRGTVEYSYGSCSAFSWLINVY
jgi:hypothetical protein